MPIHTDPDGDVVSFFAPEFSPDSLRAASWAQRWSEFQSGRWVYGQSEEQLSSAIGLALLEEAKELPDEQLARQFCFFLSLDPPAISFSCLGFFKLHGVLFDSLDPIERLLVSEDPSDLSDRGYSDEDYANQNSDASDNRNDSDSPPPTAKQLALDALNAGFGWSRSMQAHFDTGVSGYNGLPVMEAILSSIALDEQLPSAGLPHLKRSL